MHWTIYFIGMLTGVLLQLPNLYYARQRFRNLRLNGKL